MAGTSQLNTTSSWKQILGWNVFSDKHPCKSNAWAPPLEPSTTQKVEWLKISNLKKLHDQKTKLNKQNGSRCKLPKLVLRINFSVFKVYLFFIISYTLIFMLFIIVCSSVKWVKHVKKNLEAPKNYGVQRNPKKLKNLPTQKNRIKSNFKTQKIGCASLYSFWPV